MPLPHELRTDAWRLFLLIKERDMPSNNTAERLQQRSGIPLERVLAALNLLWSDDAGFIRVDIDRRTQVAGYFADPRCKRKTQADLDALYANWELIKAEDDDEDDWADVEAAEESDEDSEWDEMDEPDDEDDEDDR